MKHKQVILSSGYTGILMVPFVYATKHHTHTHFYCDLTDQHLTYFHRHCLQSHATNKKQKVKNKNSMITHLHVTPYLVNFTQFKNCKNEPLGLED